MEVRFQPTEKDYLNVMRASTTSGWPMFQFLLSFVPLFLLGIFLGANGFATGSAVCIGLGIVVAFAGYEVPRFQLRRRVRAKVFKKEECAITLDEKGVAACIPFGNVQYEWRRFEQYRETEALFLLCTSPSELSGFQRGSCRWSR